MSEKKRGWGIFFILKSLVFLAVLAAAFCFGYIVASMQTGVYILPGFIVLTMVLGVGKWLTKGWILSGWYHMMLGLGSLLAYYGGIIGGLKRSGVDEAVMKFFMPW